MLTFVTPHLHLDSVVQLDQSLLAAYGLEGLLLDLDCTLKNHGADVFPRAVLAWVEELKGRGIRLCILSNGRPGRVGRLAAELGIPFVAKAYKPLPFRCRLGVRTLALPRHKVALVGDQIFADVLAGRLAGVKTVLVRPTSAEEPWFTRLKRPLERVVLRRLEPTLQASSTQAGDLAALEK